MQKTVFALAFALTALAASNPALAADPADGAKPVKEKMICRAEESTGSIMRKRTCHTTAEWAQIDKQNAATAKDAIDRRNDGNLQLGSRGVGNPQLPQ